jgi:hypothetical protein
MKNGRQYKRVTEQPESIRKEIATTNLNYMVIKSKNGKVDLDGGGIQKKIQR